MISKVYSITIKESKQLVAHAISEAKSFGVSVSVAIVDRNGYLFLLERMEGALNASASIAEGKATTAVLTEPEGSSFFVNSVLECKSPIKLNSIKKPHVPSEGGFPIIKNGLVVAGIAVAGSMNLKLDKKIAEEVLNKFNS